MSFMEYESPRSCLSHNIPYNNYTFDERHALLTLGHTREIPRGYTVGGPVVGMQTRTMMGREDPVVETGPARRRIAIAVGADTEILLLHPHAIGGCCRILFHHIQVAT
jgi:hypothetical protein